MSIIRKCHERVRKMSPHVITTIKIEGEEGVKNKLTQNIKSVEEKVGHALKRTAP